jgi:hypothetical protein
VWPFEAMNSLGAYVASAATTIVFDLNLLGTWAATVESTPGEDEDDAVVVEDEVVVELELFLLLPHPATSPATSRIGTIVRTRFVGGSMGFLPFAGGRSACEFRRVASRV